MNTRLIESKGKSPLPPVQHEEVVVRAREFWQKAGSPAGRDLEFWLAAEHDLRLERENVKDAVAPVAPAGSSPGETAGPAGGLRLKRKSAVATEINPASQPDVPH
jgi:hypothetical protein